jgi:enterochelin esterase-like enzyme
MLRWTVFSIAACVLISANAASANPHQNHPSRWKTVHVSCSAKAQRLGGGRDVIVHLPASYHANPKKHYPVIYVQDGQNAFEMNAMMGGLQIHHVAAGLNKEAIIVGIPSAPSGENRYYEALGHTHFSEPDRVAQHSAYAHYVSHDLTAAIDRQFRTVKKAEGRALLGVSFNADAAVHIGLRHQDVFKDVVAMSGGHGSSLPNMAYYLGERAKKAPAGKPLAGRTNVILAIGGRHDMYEKVDNKWKLKALLEQHGLITGKDLHMLSYDWGSHNEPAWRQQLNDVLPKLSFFR